MDCVECGESIEQIQEENPTEAVIRHMETEHDFFSDEE